MQAGGRGAQSLCSCTVPAASTSCLCFKRPSTSWTQNGLGLASLHSQMETPSHQSGVSPQKEWPPPQGSPRAPPRPALLQPASWHQEDQAEPEGGRAVGWSLEASGRAGPSGWSRAQHPLTLHPSSQQREDTTVPGLCISIRNLWHLPWSGWGRGDRLGLAGSLNKQKAPWGRRRATTSHSLTESVTVSDNSWQTLSKARRCPALVLGLGPKTVCVRPKA